MQQALRGSGEFWMWARFCRFDAMCVRWLRYVAIGGCNGQYSLLCIMIGSSSVAVMLMGQRSMGWSFGRLLRL
jgi:hypothetical protein